MLERAGEFKIESSDCGWCKDKRFGLRSASGEVERRRRGASNEAQPERNAAAEPQTEARRSCGTVRMPLVTSARFEQRNRRGREGVGADR